ncbi:helix-turn-helix domain-containing protein [Alicyclobacillus macrosporangiidus]|nr:helix-turn-helix domain-containing protein [Alicyclobacillus macrosporangiidus]
MTMKTVSVTRNLIAPDEKEVTNIKEVVRKLGSVAESEQRYLLVDQAKGQEIELPRALFMVLLEAAKQLAKGNSVSILHYEQELTTQQAADLLQVSRPYLIKLLESGQIPYHHVGSHRRIRMRDVLEYKKTRDALRRAHLQEMVRVSEALGLYDEDNQDFLKE